MGLDGLDDVPVAGVDQDRGRGDEAAFEGAVEIDDIEDVVFDPRRAFIDRLEEFFAIPAMPVEDAIKDRRGVENLAQRFTEVPETIAVKG